MQKYVSKFFEFHKKIWNVEHVNWSLAKIKFLSQIKETFECKFAFDSSMD